MVWDGCAITVSIHQGSIFRSINFTATKDVMEIDIMAAVGNWQLRVDLQELCLAKYKNRGAVTTADVVTVLFCFSTLKDEVLNQIVDAIDFEEEIKTRTIKIIRRNKTGILEK
jgi:hypothetical protein